MTLKVKTFKKKKGGRASKEVGKGTVFKFGGFFVGRGRVSG